MGENYEGISSSSLSNSVGVSQTQKDEVEEETASNM